MRNFHEEKNTSVLKTALISTVISIVVFIAGSMFLVETGYFAGSKSVGEISNEYSLPSVDSQSRIVEIVENSNPAVVSVIVSKDIPNVRQLGPFQIQVPGDGGERQVGGGSGFFISEDGLIMTNKHVVSDEEANYRIVTSTGEEFEAEVLDRDPFNDLAILKVSEERDFPHLSFGDSSDLRLGEAVIAIGNALGEFSNSVSVGVVSGLSRSVVAGGVFGQTEFLDEVIQTDAAINPGNSGGPLFNLEGEVVGVNVAVAQGSENIAFALPANLARQAYESVLKHGEIVRPWLGVRYVEITPDVAEEEDLPVDQGVYIIGGGTISEPAVVPGSPAARAGLQEGDIVTSINGEEVSGRGSLGRVIRKHSVGETVEIVFLRNGSQRSVAVDLERAPADI